MAETLGFLLIELGAAALGVEGAGAFGATAIFGSFTVASAVGGVALLSASLATAYFLSSPEVPKPSDGTAPLRQAITARPFGYGRARLAGAYMLFETRASFTVSMDVLAVHDGKITGFILYYLDDDLVSLSATAQTNGQLNFSDAVRYAANLGGAVLIQTRLGETPETNYAAVTAALPTKWTSAHRGDGIASMFVQCDGNTDAENFTRWFPRGLPKPSAVADLSPIYDPRDVTQVRADPTTWGRIAVTGATTPSVAVTGAADNGSGAIRLAVSSTANWSTGQSKTVSGVGGTTEANGTWLITVIDSTHIDLQGSTFTNPYTSGGSIPAGWVRLTVTSTARLRDRDIYRIAGVGGTTEANGIRQITIVDATHIDLLAGGSGGGGGTIGDPISGGYVEFVHAYTSGGAVFYADANPVLQLIDLLTQQMGLDWDVLIAPVVASLMAEADICDEAMAKRDGSTEPRYASNGWFYRSTDPAEIFATLLGTCDGWMCENGDGALAFKVGKYRAPTVTFTDDHIIGFELQKGLGDEDHVNEIKISYTAPQNDYKEAPAVPWREEADISELGEVKSRSMELTWVQSHSQARRIAKRQMARFQAVGRGTLTTNLYGLRGLGERWIGVQSRMITDLGNAVVEVLPHPRVDLMSGTVSFSFVIVNPNSVDAWDPATEEVDPPQYFHRFDGLSIAPDNPSDSFAVSFTALSPTQPWNDYAVDYRVGSSGPWTRQIILNPGNSFQTAPVPPATYNVRIAVFGPQGSTNDLLWAPSVNGTSVTIA